MQYRVMVTRDVTESVEVTVEAESPATADEAALYFVQTAALVEWELDDDTMSTPYIGAPGDAELVQP